MLFKDCEWTDGRTDGWMEGQTDDDDDDDDGWWVITIVQLQSSAQVSLKNEQISQNHAKKNSLHLPLQSTPPAWEEPVISVVYPGSHDLQLACPAKSWYFPIGQSSQKAGDLSSRLR